jgi:hypothetical protein
MPTPGLDAGGVTPQLKLRLKFYCSWNRSFCLLVYLSFPIDFLRVFLCLFFVFVSFIIVGFLFLLLLLLLFFSFYTISHPFHSPSVSCAKIIAPLSPTNHSAWSPPTLFLQPSHSPSILPQPVTRLPLLHIHHPLNNLLYQLYTTPTPAIPSTNTLFYDRYIPKHTQGPQ